MVIAVSCDKCERNTERTHNYLNDSLRLNFGVNRKLP